MNQEQAQAILDEAQSIYGNAVNYYNDIRANSRSDKMLDAAEKQMLEAYEHLLDMRMKVRVETGTYAVGC